MSEPTIEEWFGERLRVERLEAVRAFIERVAGHIAVCEMTVLKNELAKMEQETNETSAR